jgi:hypothetical protein
MEENSVVILPEGSELPEEAKENAEIIGFLQNDGSLRVAFSKSDAPESFENMSELFRYVGSLKNNV